MSRRRAADKRLVLPDPIYNSVVLNKFINEVMVGGKKTIAQKIVYGALDIIKSNSQSDDPLEYFQKSINNVKPSVEVKSRRVGGATYQVPMEVTSFRGSNLALRWIVKASRKRTGKTIALKLAAELMDASKSSGDAIRKKQESHKMSEANRAFAHFRY